MRCTVTRIRRSLILGGILLTALAHPGLAGAQEEPRFLAAPGRGSQTAPGGGYFLLEARPGQSVEQSIGLRNDSKGTLDLRLVPVDATTGPLGGVSYGLEHEDRRAVGSWIQLQREGITLAPGASKTIPFSVSIPTDAAPGEHVGGISVFVPAEEEGRGPTETGAAVVVRSRRIVAVQVQLPGGDPAHIDIRGVEAAARPDGLYLEVLVANDGGGLTKGTGLIELPDEGFSREFSIDTFLPRTAIRYPVKWTTEPRKGTFAGSVHIQYVGKHAMWEGTFTVGERIREELADRRVGPGGGSSPPLILGILIGAGVAAVLFVMLTLFLRRSRSEPA
jgi:hypothetical protein